MSNRQRATRHGPDNPHELAGMLADPASAANTAADASDEVARLRAELRASEERYQAHVRATGQITWTARGDAGDRWNGDGRDWRVYTGQDAKAAAAWGWLDAAHPDDRERVRTEWGAAVAAGAEYAIEYRVRRHDGDYRWLAVHGVPVLEADGRVREWVGTATDVTERKQADAELADLERLQAISGQLIREGNLDALYQQIVDAAIALMRSDAGSMQMLDPDRDALQLLAWRGFDPASAAFWEWVGVDSHASCGAALCTSERVVIADVEAHDALAGTDDLECYHRSRLVAVQSTPLMARDGRLVGMLSTHWRAPHRPAERELRLLDVLARQAADLIERTRAEAAARASDERLRAESAARAHALEVIFETAGDGIVIYDNAGSLVQWNRAIAEMFEFDRDPAYPGLPVAMRPARLRVRDEHDQPMPAERLPFMRAVRGETLTGARAVDLIFTTRSGAVKHISASAAPLRNDSGHTIGAVAIYRDVTARRRLEHEARTSAERLQLALDASSSGTFIWYPAEDRGEPDERMLRLFGLPPDGTLNLAAALATMIHVDDRQRYAEAVARAAGPDGSGELREDIRVVLPNGVERWLAITAQVYFEDEPGGPRRAVRMAGTATDITERKRLEQQTHDALEALLAMASVLVAASGGGDGEADAAEVVRRAVRQVVVLAQRVVGGAYTSVVLEDETTRAIEPLAVVGLAPEHEAAWWASVTGARLEDYLSPADAARLRAGEVVLVANATEHPPVPGQDYWDLQTNLVVPVQLERQLLVLSVEVRDRPTFTPPERDLARAAARLSALVIERERLRQDRAAANARALAAKATNDRLHTFVGVAGHELRTPVTSVRASVQLAERALRASLAADLPRGVDTRLTRAHGMLERADQQIVRLNRLVEDLLDATRIAAGKLELRLAADDLGDVVREAVETQRLAWPSRAIELDLPDVPLTLSLDADRVEQVITNYLTNALKYSDADHPVFVAVTAEGDAMRVAVRDEGPGLTPEAQAQLWEPFHQVEGIRQRSGSGIGLGLGLHICKTIVERHGGQVGVASAPGEGSTFWFTLPLAGDPDAAGGVGA